MLYDLAHSTLLLFYLLKKRMAVQIGNVIPEPEFSTTNFQHCLYNVAIFSFF